MLRTLIEYLFSYFYTVHIYPVFSLWTLKIIYFSIQILKLLFISKRSYIASSTLTSKILIAYGHNQL